MKKLNFSGVNIAGARSLTREEMRGVMGGIIDRQTWLKMCLEGKMGGAGDTGNETPQDIINVAICEELFDDMVV